jgi:CheY-like chemotaxis protein
MGKLGRLGWVKRGGFARSTGWPLRQSLTDRPLIERSRSVAVHDSVNRGADVMTAASAGEALHLLAHHPFDVLVADIGMPEQDGLALIREIREQPAPAYRSIPAIAVTAYAAVRERDEALQAGFHFHLSKPVDPDQLVLAVSTAITRAGRSERA